MKNSVVCSRHIQFCHIILITAFFFSALILPEKLTAAESLEPITLQLKWFHQFQFAGYYAAMEKGYYEQEGLDVTIIERDLNHSPVDQVLEGKADFGVGNSAILYQYLKGRDVVLLASIFQHSPLVFLSKNTPLLHNIHDFVGKRVLMSLTSQDIELKAALLMEGIKLDDIGIVDRFASPEDYLDPGFDVIAAYTTNQPYYLTQHNVPFSIIYPSTYGIDFYGDTLFTSRRQAQEHPELVDKFVRASLKGWTYALNNSDEMIDIIINKFGSVKSKDHLRYEADEIKRLILPDLVKIGHSNPRRWQHISDTFHRLDTDLTDRNLDDFFFDPSVDNLVLKRKTAIYATSLFLAIIVILFFTIHIAKKLEKEVNSRKIFERELKKGKNITAVFLKTQEPQQSLSGRTQ